MLVEIIVPTYNRLNLLKETIDSVLKQKVGSNYYLKIIVSDNSTNENTSNYFSSLDNTIITYLRRKPTLSAIEHLETIVKEVTGDLFMIFHDDDIMEDNMLANLLAGLSDDNAAIAGNPWVLRNEIIKGQFVKNLQDSYQIITKQQLLLPYLKRRDFVPFPGYLYRKEIAGIKFDKKYGKHNDVYFLAQVLKYGSIKILEKPLYCYRIHNGQDSFSSDFVGKLNLIQYIIKSCGLEKNNPDVITCRLYNIYDELRTRMFDGEMLKTRTTVRFILLCIKHRNYKLAIKMLIRIFTNFSQ